MIETDLLVIGSGLAGCITALFSADSGMKVILVTSSIKENQCNTAKAQGGIIYKGKNDSHNLLVGDIWKAGCKFGSLEAIEKLVSSGANDIEDVFFERLQIPFDKDSQGNLDLTSEGAHSISRIIHCKDSTGSIIHQHVMQAVSNHNNIEILKNSTAIDLLTTSHSSLEVKDIYQENRCFGAYIFSSKTKKVLTIIAKDTVLATGGLGGLFLHSSNSEAARGDGIAMARRAGARIVNMEFIQFHPTGLFHPAKKRFLLSESLRGEGAKLINHLGEEFMHEYHEQKDLAPRDIVARAIYDQMIRFEKQFVYLDISHKDSDWIRKRFPLITSTCLDYGYDLTKEPVPVVPVAHYTCGGILVDLQGNTNIKSLKAVGEVSCTGVHGANRLASSSLLECLVWGRSAAKDIFANKKKSFTFPKVSPWKYEYETQDKALIYQDWQTLRNTMWNYVGPVRSYRRLERANTILANLRWGIENFYNQAELSDEIIGLRNGIDAALTVLHAAIRNKKSKGCHFYEIK